MKDHIRISKADRDNAKEQLSRILRNGDTVYTVLRKVSSSGMSRRIDCYAFGWRDNKPEKYYLSGYVAALLDKTYYPENGIKVDGCGMDMGFHLVDCLSAKLFGYTKTESGLTANGRLNQEWI